jgi:hypothetical protein
MRAALAILALALVLAATACGGDSGSGTSATPTTVDTTAAGSAQSLIAAAGTKTADAGSARVSFKASFDGPTSGSMTGEGVFAERQGHLTLDMSGLGGAGGVLPDGKIELIFDKLVYYMKLPGASGLPLPPGKEWFKIDLQQLGETHSLNLGQLAQLDQSDPSQALDLLRGASSGFHKVGSEEVRGVPTTHYEGTVDLTKVAEDAPPDIAEQYRKLAQLAPSTEVPLEAWVDEDGLVRRIRLEQSLGENATMTMEEEFYDFGADVDVAPPPDDQVVDLTGLLGQS